MPATPSIGSPLGSFLPAGASSGAGEAGFDGDLFGAFIAQVDQLQGQALPEAAPDVTTLLGAPEGLAPTTQSTVKLGDTAIEVQGEATLVQVLTQTVTVMYQQLATQGFQVGAKGPTGDLAAALTNLGLPADEAQALAAKIDTMLQLLQQQLEANKECAGCDAQSLVAVMLAALANQEQLQQLTGQQAQSVTSQSVSIVSVQVTTTTVAVQQVRVAGASTAAASDILGALAGGNAAPIRVQVKPQAAPQVQVAIVPVADESDSAEVALNATPTLQIALPENPIVPTEGQAAQGAALAPTVQPIKAPTAIQGQEMYKLTETPTGTAILQALAPKAVEEAANPAATAPEKLPTLSKVEAAPAVDTAALANLAAATQTETKSENTPSATFAKHLVEAGKAQAMNQVSIAVQPLLKGDGGAVRMTLNPPELGRIEIHLKIEAGQVTGAIAASDPAVVEHLARELPTLRQSFTEAGLKIGEQGLSLMLNNNAPQDQGQQPNPFAQPQGQTNGRSGRGGTDEAEESLTVEASAARLPGNWSAPDRLIDVAI